MLTCFASSHFICPLCPLGQRWHPLDFIILFLCSGISTWTCSLVSSLYNISCWICYSSFHDKITDYLVEVESLLGIWLWGQSDEVHCQRLNLKDLLENSYSRQVAARIQQSSMTYLCLDGNYSSKEGISHLAWIQNHISTNVQDQHTSFLPVRMKY